MKIRKRILTATWFLLAIPFLIICAYLSSNYWGDQSVNATNTQVTPVLNKNSINLNNLLTLTNQDRANSGITPLSLDNSLNASAQARCDDMAAKGYYSHDDPAGNPWYMTLRKFVPAYQEATENIDANFDNQTAESINQLFMNSPEHRKNILDTIDTNVGFATCEGTYQNRPTVFVVEHFDKPVTISAFNPHNLPPCPQYDPNSYANWVPGIDCQ